MTNTIKAVINRKFESVKFFGVDQHDGLITTFFENGIDNEMDNEEIIDALNERHNDMRELQDLELEKIEVEFE